MNLFYFLSLILIIATDNEIQQIEKSLILGLRDINHTYLAKVYKNDTGVIPSLSTIESSLEYNNENKEQFKKLMNLYSNTMDSISAHDDRYKTILQLLKRGCIQT